MSLWVMLFFDGLYDEVTIGGWCGFVDYTGEMGDMFRVWFVFGVWDVCNGSGVVGIPVSEET